MININELTNTQKIDLIKDKLFNSFIIHYPKLHKEVFEKLAVDKYRDVRSNLADNPNLPASVIEILAVDKDWIVRYCLSRKTGFIH